MQAQAQRWKYREARTKMQPQMRGPWDADFETQEFRRRQEDSEPQILRHKYAERRRKNADADT